MVYHEHSQIFDVRLDIQIYCLPMGIFYFANSHVVLYHVDLTIDYLMDFHRDDL